MAQDKNMQETVESVLHAMGVSNSGAVAEAIVAEIGDYQVRIDKRDVVIKSLTDYIDNVREGCDMVMSTVDDLKALVDDTTPIDEPKPYTGTVRKP